MKDKGGNPFAMQFINKGDDYYGTTSEGRRVVKAATVAIEAVTGQSSGHQLTPKSAMMQLFEAMTSKEDMLCYGASLIAAWLERDPPREQRSMFLTLLARGNLDDIVGKKGTVRERQVAQMARVVATIVSRVPARNIGVFAEWAADMSVAVPDTYDVQPVAVIRGVLFFTDVVSAFDVERAMVFWDRAIKKRTDKEPEFPWRVFSHPCRADRGIILTEYHMKAVGKMLTVAPDYAVDRIAQQMLQHAKYKNVDVPGTDDLGGSRRAQEPTLATDAERRQMFLCIRSDVSDVIHVGRRARVDNLFLEVTG